MYGCLRKENDMDEFAARPVADILARYSTDNQNPVTIDVQVEKCREWCERNGYQVGKIFSDEAVSGMKETRVGYEACMMHLAWAARSLWSCTTKAVCSANLPSGFSSEKTWICWEHGWPV